MLELGAGGGAGGGGVEKGDAVHLHSRARARLRQQRERARLAAAGVAGGERRIFTVRQSTRYEKIIASSVSDDREGGEYGGRRGRRDARARAKGVGEFTRRGRRRGAAGRDRDGEIQLKILHITRYTAKMYLLFKSDGYGGGARPSRPHTPAETHYARGPYCLR